MNNIPGLVIIKNNKRKERKSKLEKTGLFNRKESKKS